jgi:biofilm PGA synthesis N-glycosyltransferase PgaC
MPGLAETVFWISAGCIGYVYAGYPLLLMLWARLAERPIRKGRYEPHVSIVIAMRNEQDRAGGRIHNCLELDYPPEKRQIVVSLDGPTDATERLVRQHAPAGVDIVLSPVHRGKAEALNDGVAAARGEVIVFTDARQRFARDALRELVANFADPSVGAVSGELVLLDTGAREASQGVGLYWKYDKRLRALESAVHSTVGATGAIYAIRRELFRPLPPGTVLDDVAVPMGIVLAGKRAIFDPAARAYDVLSPSPAGEFRRKVRTLMGNYQLLVRMPELLLPWRNPLFVQLVSHKLGRLAAAYCFAGLLVSNLFLTDGIYLVTLTLQFLWYGLAVLGGWITSRDDRAQASESPGPQVASSSRHLAGFKPRGVEHATNV